MFPLAALPTDPTESVKSEKRLSESVSDQLLHSSPLCTVILRLWRTKAKLSTLFSSRSDQLLRSSLLCTVILQHWRTKAKLSTLCSSRSKRIIIFRNKACFQDRLLNCI